LKDEVGLVDNVIWECTSVAVGKLKNEHLLCFGNGVSAVVFVLLRETMTAVHLSKPFPYGIYFHYCCSRERHGTSTSVWRYGEDATPTREERRQGFENSLASIP
jgi:hypothetical protein